MKWGTIDYLMKPVAPDNWRGLSGSPSSKKAKVDIRKMRTWSCSGGLWGATRLFDIL